MKNLRNNPYLYRINNTKMKTLLTIIVILSSVASTFGQAGTEYKTTLKKMFEVSGTQEAYKSAVRQMFVMFKQNKDVPEQVWADLEKEFLLASIDELVDMLTPVYEKHLSNADLKKVIEFYQTPVGVKFAQKSPSIMQESMQIGQQWGMKIGESFQQKLKEKGY
jgi:hypothetical protein